MKKRDTIFLILISVLLGIGLFSYFFFRNQPIPNCSEDEALYFYWNDYNLIRYECIPDPQDCSSLVTGISDIEACDERSDCVSNCHSTCRLCADVKCECIPKNFEEYL